MEGGEELEKAIKELPHDKEVVQLYQNSPAQILFPRAETDGLRREIETRIGHAG
jgi:hypothetical protein